MRGILSGDMKGREKANIFSTAPKGSSVSRNYLHFSRLFIRQIIVA